MYFCDALGSENMANISEMQLPINFGIEYLDSPAHGNLRFLCKGDEELLANSAIMSFNSPVIKKTTIGDHGRTSVDVQDFSKEVVRCFLEASYSGSLREMPRSLFRDLTKMADVFEVSWIVEECFVYFTSFLDNVKDDDFPNQLDLFNESVYIFEHLKNKTFIAATIKRFRSIKNCTENFVIHFLDDISICSAKNLDVLMEMLDELTLVKVLINNLKKGKSSLDQNCRRILETLNFATCSPAEEPHFQELLELLHDIENPSTDDYRLIIKLFRQSKGPRARVETVQLLALPNLFNGIEKLEKNKTLDELMTFLLNSPLVKNFHMSFDALDIWSFEHFGGSTEGIPSIPVQSLENAAEVKNWEYLSLEYVNSKSMPHLGGLAETILQNPSLITHDNYNRLTSISDYTPDELFGRNHDIKFKFEQGVDTNLCLKIQGDCGFILRVTPASFETRTSLNNSFNIELLVDSKLYPDDIHFHKDGLTAENLHFALDIHLADGMSYFNYPVTWCGKPLQDQSRTYWCWGKHRFFKGEDAERILHKKEIFHSWVWYWGSTARIRPVVFYFQDV